MTEADVQAKPCRILLAEDDDAMRDLLVGWLRDDGYEVTTCTNGCDLLSQLEGSVLSDEFIGFDLVLSDIHMPEGSGLEVLDEFFGCDGIPPAILITAFGDLRTRALANHLGAVVLEKPFQKENLMAEIRRLPIGLGGGS